MWFGMFYWIGDRPPNIFFQCFSLILPETVQHVIISWDFRVISTKLQKLRYNFRIVKIRFGDCRFQIVRHSCQRHAAKIAETIFQRPDEILRILQQQAFRE